MKTKKIATFGMLIALAMIFSYIESILPINLGIPGIKLGLANILTIVSLYLIGVRGAVFVSLLRIILVGLTFGNGSAMLFSLSGGICSLVCMVLVKEIKIFSVYGVSMVGGVMHNVGQILMAMRVLDESKILSYLPVLVISGVLTGMVIGLIAGQVIDRIHPVWEKM